MLGLNTHIKIFVIRNAAGISPFGQFRVPAKPSSITYKSSLSINLRSDPQKGSNSQLLVLPDTVKNIADASGKAAIDRANFASFLHQDLNTEVLSSTKLKRGDEVWFVARELLTIDRALLRTVLSNILPDKIGIGQVT